MSEGIVLVTKGSLNDLRNGRYKFPGKPTLTKLGNLTGKARRNKKHHISQKLKRQAIKRGEAEPTTRDEIINHELLTHESSRRKELETKYREKAYRLGDNKSVELELRRKNTKKTAMNLVKTTGFDTKYIVATKELGLKLPKMPAKLERKRYTDKPGLSSKTEWIRNVHLRNAAKARKKYYYPRSGAQTFRDDDEAEPRLPSAKYSHGKPSHHSNSVFPTNEVEGHDVGSSSLMLDALESQGNMDGVEYAVADDDLEDSCYD
ncbi:MAG: hypothetical protein MMC33_009810 [Icmadophila ericetorum]|nr:hypothetical protein [Icmadophila ericetorum]